MSANRRSLAFRIVLTLFFLATLGYIGFTFWALAQLPDQVPAHFDGAGNPDRISGKAELAWGNVGVAGLMVALFGIFPFFLHKIPHKHWNLPNKDYWLAPGRKAETLARMQLYFVGMGLATMLLLGSIAWGIYQVGSGARETLPFSWWGMGLYLVVVGWMTVAMCRFFFQKPKE